MRVRFPSSTPTAEIKKMNFYITKLPNGDFRVVCPGNYVQDFNSEQEATKFAEAVDVATANDDGYDDGYHSGYDDGFYEGYNAGYDVGYDEASYTDDSQ